MLKEGADCHVVPLEAGLLAMTEKWIPTFAGPSTPLRATSLGAEKWIPAFAGMTKRGAGMTRIGEWC